MESSRGFWDFLTSEERRALSALGRGKTYSSRATLCVEGDPATHVFILVTGWVKIFSVADNGHESMLAVRGEGDLVGETAGELAGHRNATLQAIGQVDALLVGYERFHAFLDNHPSASRAYRHMMAQRWIDADMMLRRRAFTTGAQRLAGLLLSLAGRHGSHGDGVIEVELPLSQHELASLAGTSRATVTRALGNWRKRGFIRTDQRRHLTLVDLPGLRQAAGPAV